MGYRNETEHLRHRVAQLEGQLETIKGQRALGREASFAAKVRRQTVIIAVLALFVSGGSAFCVLPIVALGLENRPVDLADVAVASTYARPVFRGTANVDEAFRTGDYGDTVIPLREDARILLFCGYDCPYELGQEVNGYRVPAGAPIERTFRGTVAIDGEYPFSGIDPARLEDYLLRHGLSRAEIRVVEVESYEDPTVGFWVILCMGAFAALCMWGTLLWHRRASRGEVPLPTGEDFATKDPGMTLLLTIVTCRVYELIWLFTSTGQIRRITGRPDLNPAIDLVLTLATGGLWGLWVFYRNVEAVDEALVDVGAYSSERNTILGLALGSFLCGVLHWVLIFKVQEAYNRLILEKMTVDDIPEP